MVITIVVPHAHLKINFWWSPKSTSARPINKKVEAVSGLKGKPTVIWPSKEALPTSSGLTPSVKLSMI
jgi:hypothetical protein